MTQGVNQQIRYTGRKLFIRLSELRNFIFMHVCVPMEVCGFEEEDISLVYFSSEKHKERSPIENTMLQYIPL